MTRLSLFLVAASTTTLGACFDGTEVRDEGGVRVVAVRHDFANSFVVEQNGGRILVDTGYEREAGELAPRFREAGVDLDVVDAIVLTHGHADHAGGARQLRADHGIPIVVGADDDGILAGGGGDPKGLCPTDGLAESRVEEDAAARYTPFDPDVLADDSAALQGLTAVDATLVFQPSHTEGSLSVVVGPFAFIGDLFRGDVFTATATVHLYNCDLEANRREIEQLLTDHPDVTTFVPSHFGAVSRAEVEALLERWPAP
jgi:hydroxyacylglutathione hydrolase